jgi:hypothetical protein
MRRTWESWLLAACDPQTVAEPPRQKLASAGLASALSAAQDHFVLGSVLRSVAAWRTDDEGIHPAQATAVRAFADFHLRDTGRTLGLRQLAYQAAQSLAAAGIPCCILKGEDFASRLYPSPVQRPYRDVDVLVPKDAFREADRVVLSLGFVPVTPDRKYAAEDYGQISYFSSSPEQWSFELHWNLINSPAQRRQCSLTWDDLTFSAEQRSAHLGGARLLTPTSLLVLACVHACVGHRFDSLQQLCDIRQICRGAAGPVDAAELAETCRRLRCETPVAWSLDLLVRLFKCVEARELAAKCKFTQQAVRPWAMLGRQTVLRPHTAASKLRRSLARVRLKNAA